MSEQSTPYNETRIDDIDKARFMAEAASYKMEEALRSKDERGQHLLTADTLKRQKIVDQNYGPTLEAKIDLAEERANLAAKVENSQRERAMAWADEEGARYDQDKAAKEARYQRALKIMAKFADQPRESEPETREKDIDKAQVLAYAIDWHAREANRHIEKGTDPSWHQRRIQQILAEVGDEYDKWQAELSKDYNQLTREDEPKTRVQDEQKAHVLALAAAYTMNRAHEALQGNGSFWRGRDDSRAEREAGYLPERARAYNSDIPLAEHDYDLEHSQTVGLVNNLEKAGIMAKVGDHYMAEALELEQNSIVTLEHAIKQCENFQNGVTSKPASGYEGYGKERMHEVITALSRRQASELERAKDLRKEAVRRMNIAGGEYDTYGPSIASKTRVTGRDKHGNVTRIDPKIFFKANNIKVDDSLL